MSEIREDCPTNDFKQGKASGKCWGDGHYMCLQCIHYRRDFKKRGQDYIDAAHTSQHGLIITVLT